MNAFPLNLIALLCLLPAAAVPFRPGAGRDAVFWIALLAALLGPAVWSLAMLAGSWQTGLGAAMWVSIAASAVLFAGLAALYGTAWRLAPLLMPYLVVLGLLASVLPSEGRPVEASAPILWLDLHILVSVLTYGLLTLAAVAALGVLLQERALKTKRPNRLTRLLPAMVEGDRLSGHLLAASEVVLGLGVVSGMAIQYFVTGQILHTDHKSLLSLIAFVLIGLLLIGHRVCGVRGRVAARVILMAYLLVTLAYPGVKFVTQVLL